MPPLQVGVRMEIGSRRMMGMRVGPPWHRGGHRAAVIF